MFIETREPPLKIARKFSERFEFGTITVEKFDMWLVDLCLVEDSGTDDTTDPRYKAFVAGRSRVMSMLNRYGGDCDDGYRFQIKPERRGKTYRVVPYAAAMLNNSLDFAPDMVKSMHNKSASLSKAERHVAEIALKGGGDSEELMKVNQIQAAMNAQTEKGVRQMRAILHKQTSDQNAAADMIEKLLLKYEGDTEE